MTDFIEHFLHEFQLPLENPVLIFSLILFIILLSPILLRKLNIPGIIGLIIAGVAIGPHGFGVLEKDAAVDLFSTIGLLYIMFIAGLELDMNEFRSNRNRSLLFGAFTFAIPLGVGFPVCYYLLDYEFNASLLTASMFATHTLVAYPIVSKFGISKNQAVAITVGGTILTDTAVLIILAVILGNSQGNLNQAFWIRLGVSLAIFSAIMFLVIPRIAKWFFQKLESEKHSHYIFVLAVVFFAAFLAEAAGVESIIGAFIAGLALNKLIPHSSALMNRIEFIGNALFIPFFLISVGMLVDVSVILKGPQALIVAASLSVVALSGKWLAALFTQLIFKYDRTQRQLIFGLSGAHAAATLAVILVGYKAGILDENILNGTIILILVTCIVASFATENAAKKLVAAADENSDTELQSAASSKEHLLLPIANIANFEALLELAIHMKSKKSTEPISILSVVSNNEEAESNILKARAKLEQFVKQASASETKVNVVTTIDFNIASGISRVSREVMASMVILGWPQKTGLLDKLIGEKVDSILSNTDRTTLICYLHQPLVLHKKILVVAPPMTEFELGFKQWVGKVTTLAEELTIGIEVFCNAATEIALRSCTKKLKSSAQLTYRQFYDWEDIMVLGKEVSPSDLIVFIGARKGSPSYLSSLANVPSKLEKHFAENNRIVVYPEQLEGIAPNERYADLSAEPIVKGLETVQKIRKSIGGWFKSTSKPST